jgi:hypothetical protein
VLIPAGGSTAEQAASERALHSAVASERLAAILEQKKKNKLRADEASS